VKVPPRSIQNCQAAVIEGLVKASAPCLSADGPAAELVVDCGSIAGFAAGGPA
jgi:hypothetical protein